MVALGATLTVGALAPRDAAAQASGRERAEASRRGGVIVDGRRDSRVDDRCYDDDRYDRDGRNDRRDDRYRNRDDRDSDSERYRRSSNRDRYDCDDIYRTSRSSKNGNGPKFCRNGQGHPVHGMAWCRDKGWDRDRGYSLRNVNWNDVYLRRVRDAARRDLGRNALEDILGRVVYSRFDNQRSRLGLNGPVMGDWRDTSGGAVLDLFANGLKFAQILDRNRDGRADVVLLAYDR